MHTFQIKILSFFLFLSHTCFDPKGLSSGRQLYMQLWYVCFTCIGISSLVSRTVLNLLVFNKHQATKHLPISHVKMKTYLITLHYSNLLTSSLRFSD
jgi:hypothetical protein